MIGLVFRSELLNNMIIHSTVKFYKKMSAVFDRPIKNTKLESILILSQKRHSCLICCKHKDNINSLAISEFLNNKTKLL